MTLLPAKPQLPQVTELIKEVSDLVVTEHNYTEICEAVVETKSQYKHLDEAEKRITKPLNEALKEAKSWFATPKKAYAEVERILKEKILGYQATLQARKIEAVKTLQIDTLAQISASPHPSEVQTREVWDMEIVDPAQVPGQFWIRIIDEAKLRSFASSGVDIPGVRFFKRAILAVKTR